MAYLSRAIVQVLDAARVNEEKSQKQETEKAQREAQAKQEEENKKSEDEEFERNKQAFLKAFPSGDEQRNYVQEVAKRFPMFRSVQTLTNLAITQWAESNRTGTSRLGHGISGEMAS